MPYGELDTIPSPSSLAVGTLGRTLRVRGRVAGSDLLRDLVEADAVVLRIAEDALQHLLQPRAGRELQVGICVFCLAGHRSGDR